MIKVNEYRCLIIDQFGLDLSILFMDELAKWDQTVPKRLLYDMFYDKDLLDMLFNQAQEIKYQT
jgi:hypothetical protein